MWGTYSEDRRDPIRDSRVFTQYVPDAIQQDKQITNNESYRQFLMENTNKIIRQNYEVVAQGNPVQPFETVDHGPPVRFTMEDRDPKPYGYEDSLPKQMYLSREQLDQKKRRLLKENY